MSCCGGRRKAYKAWLAPRPVRLRFLGEGRVEAKGTATGKPYVASESTREIDVDPRDANAFLQGGKFVMA